MGRIGNQGEKKFVSICADSDIVCTKPDEDINGWDYLLEIPTLNDPTLPPDKQSPDIKIFAQIKSTPKNRKTVSIKLSNAIKAVQSDLPFFIFAMLLQENGTLKVFGVHFWEKHIEKTLMRARKAQFDSPPNLHKKTISISFSEMDEVTDLNHLKKWILDKIAPHSKNYPQFKKKLRDETGYSTQRGIGRFTLNNISDEEIANHQLGLGNNLPVSNLTIHEIRFGIKSINPEIHFSDGYIQISGAEEQGKLIFTNSDDLNLQMPCIVKIPTLLDPKNSAYKLRVISGVIDFLISRDDSELKLKISSDRKLTPDELERFIVLMNYAQNSSITINLESNFHSIYSGVLDAELNDGWRKWITHASGLSYFLKNIEDIKELIQLSIDETYELISKLHPASLLFSNHQIRIEGEVESNAPNPKYVYGYLAQEYNDLYIGAIFRSVIKHTKKSKNIVQYYFSKGEILDSFATKEYVQQATESMVKKFENHIEKAQYPIIVIDDGNLTRMNNNQGKGFDISIYTPN